MQKEIDPLLELLGERECETIFEGRYYTFKDYPDVVAVCGGVGEINAALAAATLIQKYNVERVINFGFAGSYSDERHVGDIVNITEVYHCDMDLRVSGKPAGQYDEYDFVSFKADPDFFKKDFPHMALSSSDRFLEDSPERDEHINLFGKNAADMEGAGIAVTCHKAGIPFSILKCISNTPEQSFKDYYEFSFGGIKHCAEAVYKAIKQI